MWLKWLPVKYIVRRLARTHGFMDPIAIISRLRSFSQPSEVNEPIELVRAGVVLHARGLINSRVIHHNLDWVWPFWVNQQFDPANKAFIPRAFSLTQINLSARNWTAVGLPGYSEFPVVDPRGLVMPYWDSWSVDAWIVSDDGENLYPSRMNQGVEQKWDFEDDNLSATTISKTDNLELSNQAKLELCDSQRVCCMKLKANSNKPAWLGVSVRPYNPEGITFIHSLEYNEKDYSWNINDKDKIFLSELPDKQLISDFKNGDVSLDLLNRKNENKVKCDVGMASAAALFKLEPNTERVVSVALPFLDRVEKTSKSYFEPSAKMQLWKNAVEPACKIELNYKNFQYLFDAAVRSVVLHSPKDVYPGPFTYKRFWFRDAAFIVYAMVCVGLHKRAEQLIDNFFPKQTSLGYFHSQQGEWDSNGQTLWVIDRYCKLSEKKPKDDWLKSIHAGAKWIIRKRTSKTSSKPAAGLLPAGFSAEHLGPNDNYYWDDFWSVAGLKAAADLLEGSKYHDKIQELRDEADDLLDCIEKTLKLCRQRIGREAIPASPHRRLDSGVIGSVSATYPLNIFDSKDPRMLDTVDYLMNNCIFRGGFFHDIQHSGINPYLTMELAQVLMRSGDMRFTGLTDTIADLASPTGQWPEAINPRTGMGCMGDGQHVWASAEWLLLMINSFAVEADNKLIIGLGVTRSWLEQSPQISIGPVMTSWGPVTINISRQQEKINVNWEASWRNKKPEIEINLPQYKKTSVTDDRNSVTLEPMQ